MSRTDTATDGPGTTASAAADLVTTIEHALEEGRARTLALVDDLDDAQLLAQHSRLMSPLVWDLAHVGNYEEQWLLRALDGRGAVEAGLDDVYDAFQHARADRPELALLDPSAARRYLGDVREAVLHLLPTLDLGPEAEQRLTRAGFVHGMVLQHEHQHDETMLATRQLMGDHAPPVPGADPAPEAPLLEPTGDVLVPAGTHLVGTSSHPWAYDNERAAHEVELPAFRIDAAPVTNRAYTAFMADRGYERPELWTQRGWAWRTEQGLRGPQFWQPEGGGSWSVLRFGRRLDLGSLLDDPVQHVCWFEADAYARWAGRRLPSEQEWEAAAAGTHPLGPANLGQRHDGPAPVGSYPGGTSAHGCHQLLGDVWEWTSSDLLPWPGFEAFPYPEYSEVFWGGDFKVLKGGSWATHPSAVRASFRNWDHPIRRQIFAGFRTAADA
jgi:iron(II)-dependent oxidoreductase